MFRSRAQPFDPRTNKIASLQSLKFHHGGLYEDYIAGLNRDIADTPIQNAGLFTIIAQSSKVARGANLEIIATQNADTPIARGKIPLLACDLWEHAYYADHQNARKSYVESFLRFADFGFASDAYCWAKKQGLGSVKLYISELHPAASSRCDCDCCG